MAALTEIRFYDRSYYKLAAGMFFLFNPLLNILDVFPDVIGYLLIFSGLKELSQIDGRLEYARKRVQYLIFISGFKLALTPAIFSSGEDTDRLLAVFCFGLAEIILLLFFTQEFFEGISYLAERNKGDKTAAAVPNAKFLSVLFFITKIALNIAPELYALIEAKEVVDVSEFDYYENLMSSKPIVQALCIFAVLILGIFWYVSVVNMLRAAKKEEEFKEKLQEHYQTDFLAYPEKQNFIDLKYGLYIAMAGLIFFFDISVDNVKVFPWAVAVLLIYIASCKMKFGAFRMTRRCFPAVFIVQLLVEAYMYIFYETDVSFLFQLSYQTITVNSIVAIVKSLTALYFVGVFLVELQKHYYLLAGDQPPTFDLTKIIFVASVCVKTLQISLPITFAAMNGIYITLFIVWLILCGKNMIYMIDDYAKAVRLL